MEKKGPEWEKKAEFPHMQRKNRELKGKLIVKSWTELEPDLGQQDTEGACLGQKDLSKVKQGQWRGWDVADKGAWARERSEEDEEQGRQS